MLVVAVVLMSLALAACADWIQPEPTLPVWDIPTIPSVAAAESGATPSPVTPTVTATITLTPVASFTPLIGPTSTLSFDQRTATAAGPVGENPSIEYFIAFPTEAIPGETVLLFWKAHNATSAAIWRINADGRPGRTYPVDVEGDFSIQVLAAGRAEEFVLSVSNGHTTVEQRVSVDASCDTPFFFEPQPQSGCGTTDPTPAGAIFQGFERGQMIFNQGTGQIIILFTDGGSPAWMSVVNPFFDGAPEDDPNLTPPEGLRQPRREIGMAWRETPTVRERLGWAIGDPTPYTTTYQRGTDSEGGDALYLTDPAGGVIYLAPDGEAWQVVAYIQ
jgi:hypothetical protein